MLRGSRTRESLPDLSPSSLSRRRDCHFDDALSPSLLRHLLKVEGGAAEWQPLANG